MYGKKIIILLNEFINYSESFNLDFTEYSFQIISFHFPKCNKGLML